MSDLESTKRKILSATPEGLDSLFESILQAEDTKARSELILQLVSTIACLSTSTEREIYINLAKEKGVVSSMLALRTDVEQEVRKREQFANDALSPTRLPGGQLTSEEYIKILEEMGYSFRLLELDETLYINRQPATDGLEAKIRVQMRDAGYKNVNVIRDAYIAHGYENRFNPIRDYLVGLKWDGKKRLDDLIHHFEDTRRTKECPAPLFGLWLKKWMVGAIIKAVESQGYQNPMLVLVSAKRYNNGQVLAAQGTGKSYWAKWMCSGLPDRFISSDINPRDKDYYRRQLLYLIWEVDELGSTTRKADVEALKSFITTPLITVRPSYARNDIRKPPIVSFIGTVNDDGVGFLPDTTGNRRFLTVEITNLDFSYVDLDIDQIWAEVKETLYLNHEFHKELSFEERQIRDDENSKYGRDSSIADFILQYYEVTHNLVDVVETNQIIEDLANSSKVSDNRRTLEMEIAKYLKAEGLEKKQKPSRWYGIKRR